MKKYIAFSGGVESTTMCILYGASADAIFADTGWEHAALYEQIKKVEARVREIHGPQFRVIKVRGCKSHKGKDYHTLPDYIKAAKFFPSPRIRFCTRVFKVEPIDKFLREQGECELMIGLNMDEQDREGNHGMMANVTYRYPLIENGITRGACVKILEKAELLPKFPAYMARGGCVGCFFKSKREFEALALLEPDEADAVAELEESVQDERGKYYGIRDGIPNLKTFFENSRQMCLIPPEQMYITSRDTHTPCGVFCHR